MSEWVPFGLDHEQTEQYRVLRDGVPRDLREPLLGWLKPLLSSGGYESISNDRTQELAMLTGLQVGLRDGTYAEWEKYVQALRGMEELSFLRLIDGVLALEWSEKQVEALDRLLRLGRSKWTVGERGGRAGLVSREPEGVQDMVEGTIASAGTAGQILSRAWGKVHALTPDDTGASADAVRAVEAAAQPLVEPTNREATLAWPNPGALAPGPRLTGRK